MNKKGFYSFFILILVLIAGAGDAFVPQAPHLLYMMTQKIVEPTGIVAIQVRAVLDPKNQDQEAVMIQEELTYSFPGKIHSQVTSENSSGFSIESDKGYIRVVNGQTIALEKSPIDMYTDILLYRDYETLLQRLADAGVDIQTVTMVRHNDLICYRIGNAMSGLWIDKETFMPVKYSVRKDGWTVEFHYSNWERVSRTWYPMVGTIFLDNQLLATINVKKFVLKTQNSDTLFDIAQAKKMYPEGQIETGRPNQSQIDELDRGIENLKNLYE